MLRLQLRRRHNNPSEKYQITFTLPPGPNPRPLATALDGVPVLEVRPNVARLIFVDGRIVMLTGVTGPRLAGSCAL